MKTLIFVILTGLAFQAQAVNRRCDFKFFKMGDADKLEAFIGKLKKVKNSVQLARLVQFPVRVNIKGKKYSLKNTKEFNKHFKSIMSDDVRSAMHYSDPNKSFCTSDGLMLGKGKVWLKFQDDAYKIIAFNP